MSNLNVRGSQGGSITYQKTDGSKQIFEEVQARGVGRLSATGYVVYGVESMEELCSFLGQDSLPGENFYDMYRVLKSTSDSVSQFMLFYLILMQHHDDKQQLVEEFIKTHEPDVIVSEIVRTGQSRKTEETIYTRLRNEIAHARGVPLKVTRAEIEQNLNGLKVLARKCLEQNS